MKKPTQAPAGKQAVPAPKVGKPDPKASKPFNADDFVSVTLPREEVV